MNLLGVQISLKKRVFFVSFGVILNRKDKNIFDLVDFGV